MKHTIDVEMDQLLSAFLRRAQLVALLMPSFDEGKLCCSFFDASTLTI
jgi:hypothetical protein